MRLDRLPTRTTRYPCRQCSTLIPWILAKQNTLHTDRRGRADVTRAVINQQGSTGPFAQLVFRRCVGRVVTVVSILHIGEYTWEMPLHKPLGAAAAARPARRDDKQRVVLCQAPQGVGCRRQWLATKVVSCLHEGIKLGIHLCFSFAGQFFEEL